MIQKTLNSWLGLAVATALVIALPMVALAAPVDPTVDPTGWAGEIYKAATSSNWAYVVAVILFGLAMLARKFGARWWPVLSTHYAGAVIALVGGTAGAVATGLSGGVGFSLDMLLGGLRVGFLAAVPFIYAMDPKDPKGKAASEGDGIGTSPSLTEVTDEDLKRTTGGGIGTSPSIVPPPPPGV